MQLFQTFNGHEILRELVAFGTLNPDMISQQWLGVQVDPSLY